MDIFSRYIYNFLLILLRTGIVISLLPFFGSKNFPAQFKIGFAVAIAFILTPIIEVKVIPTEIPILVMREVIFGIALGLIARSIFVGIEMAGHFASNAIGLSISSIFDPEIGQSAELAKLYGVITMLIFLSLDVHHDIIYVLVRSYEWLPSGHLNNIKSLVGDIVSVTARMFIIAIKISAPVIVAMLISHLLLGFLYKAAPQMNIFFVGFPVYIFIGFIVILISIPVCIHIIGGYIQGIKDELIRIINIARG
ncbi:MAG: flagellar biosynthetic protein FliR [Thermodesulfovibrionales bacterium]